MVVQRDRSGELYSIFDALRAQGIVKPPTPHDTTGNSQEVRRFHTFSQAFANDIAATSESIGNLAKLVKQQNVFDDQATEISSLTTIIKGKLHQLHDDLDTLVQLKESAIASQKSAWSSAKKQSERHTETVVDALRSKLVHTSQNFKGVLQERTRMMKDTANRRNQFSSDKPTTFESALFQGTDERDLQSGDGRSQQLALTSQNVSYFRNRHEAVRQVEMAVNEVGEMFQDFTRLVHEQEEMVVRIDSNVDDALRNVNQGSSELMKYLANLSSNRGLILKIFAVLFVFLLFFGFVVVR